MVQNIPSLEPLNSLLVTEHARLVQPFSLFLHQRTTQGIMRPSGMIAASVLAPLRRQRSMEKHETTSFVFAAVRDADVCHRREIRLDVDL